MHLHLLHIPLFLGLALLCPSILALTLAQGTTSLVTPTTPNSGLNVTAGDKKFTCNRITSQTRAAPGFADCAGVLRQLPLNPTVGTFYNTGRGDFQLPHFVSYRTCTVIISLRRSVDKVQSSWLAVQVAAMQLNEACQDIRAMPGLGYATTFIDDLDVMTVTLTGPQRALDGKNGTIETS